ncbi:hypothetical protein [Archangium violaceum]|uniref:Knr4/Smi1-like domain-containing protein n=1 Tax=Archangium violaceum Cb vi76 TaxID=1406225 RepID=A0A084T137_9BACT|nr:hypothetical protein [Archangium violaceum]KFA94422.1 hypothetical protein Q664_02515 [Archangium violaceum Cb vi76]
MTALNLSGLERLMRTCERLGLGFRTEPPGNHPPAAGVQLAGHVLDPVLAVLYARLGKAAFATDSAGLVLLRVDDDVNELESENRLEQGSPLESLAIPVLVFGGEPGLAYSYATVPRLADEHQLQPVVLVDTHEEPYALPVASNVDRFFDTWSRYLEALVAQPDYAQYGSAALTFPWGVPHLLARDRELVESLRTGRFGPLMKKTDSTARWVAQVLSSSRDD